MRRRSPAARVPRSKRRRSLGRRSSRRLATGRGHGLAKSHGHRRPGQPSPAQARQRMPSHRHPRSHPLDNPSGRSCSHPHKTPGQNPQAQPPQWRNTPATPLPHHLGMVQTCHPPNASVSTPARARTVAATARAAGCARTRRGSSPTCCATRSCTGGFPDGVAAPRGRPRRRLPRLPQHRPRRRWTCCAPKGWSSGCPGVGTVVVVREVPARPRPAAWASPRPCTSTARSPTRSAPSAPSPPPPPSPTGCDVPPGTDVLYIERLRRLNGLPLSLDLTYIPLDIGADAARRRPGEHRRLPAPGDDHRPAARAPPRSPWRRSTPTRTPPPCSRPRAAPPC